MTKRILAALAILSASSAHAMDVLSGGAPTCGATDAYLYALTDATSASGCGTSGGSTYVSCICLAGNRYAVSPSASTAIALAANGGNCGVGEAAQGVDASGVAEGCFTPAGGGNSFETINTPAGTDPVADSSTDTLNLTSSDSSITITGTSGTDTVDLVVVDSAVDHGGLGGLADDDHTQYALLAGRTGQTLYGGTGTTHTLGLCANDESGEACISLDADKTMTLAPNGVAAQGWFKIDTDGTLIFEGQNTDDYETSFAFTAQTADRTLTIPNADTATVQAASCAAGEAITAISATTGISTCTTVGATAGDSVTVNSSATTNANLLDGDIDWTLDTAPSPDNITGTVACTACVNDTDADNDLTIESQANIATDLCVGLGDRDADTNRTQVCRDSSDRIYVDKDSDETRDAGEPLILDEYDPNQPPVSCAVCDEFSNNTPSLSWTQGNPDSSIYTASYDSYFINGDTAANEEHVLATDTPSSGNTNFTLTVRVEWATHNAPVADGCSIGLIEQGTIATPTDLTVFHVLENSTTYLSDVIQIGTATSYAYAGFALSGSATSVEAKFFRSEHFYLQLRYTDSSRALDAYYSFNGIDFVQVGSTATLSADPPFMFISAKDGAVCRFSWVRARTDVDRNNASD